jgi:hypothetical protein
MSCSSWLDFHQTLFCLYANHPWSVEAFLSFFTFYFFEYENSIMPLLRSLSYFQCPFIRRLVNVSSSRCSSLVRTTQVDLWGSDLKHA